MHRSAYLFTAALMFTGATLSAGTGEDGYVQIHNNAKSTVLIGFYTESGSELSENWLDADLQPASKVTVDFDASEGTCAKMFVAGWLADENESEDLDEAISIDICKATNIYIDDDSLTVD